MSSKLPRLQRIRWVTLIASLLIYVASLTQSAFSYRDFDGVKEHSALSVLVMGALAVLGGGLFETIVWLANPLFYVALMLFFAGNKAAKTFAVAALVLALSFITWKEVLAAENGRSATILQRQAGYWLWTGSMLVLAIGISSYNNARKNARVGGPAGGFDFEHSKLESDHADEDALQWPRQR